MNIFSEILSHLRCSVAALCMALVGCASPMLDLHEMHHRAKAMVDHGDHELARPYVDSCLALFPNDAELHLRRAECIMADRRLDDARDELSLALSLTPEDSCKLATEILVLRGHVNRYRGEYRDAYENFHAAYLRDFNCPPSGVEDVHFYLVNMGGTASSFDLILGDSIAGELVRQFPDDIDGYDLHARMLLKLQKYAAAIGACDTILHQFSDSSGTEFTYLTRGNAQQALGNLPAACADWRKSVELGLDMAQAKLDSFCREQ